jgi:hypothetical protein
VSWEPRSRLTADVLAESARSLRQLAADLPLDLPCTTLLRCGGTIAEIRRLLAEDRHDVVLIALQPHGRLRGAEPDLVLLAPTERRAALHALADTPLPTVGGNHQEDDAAE